jgi:hypothetical protein
MGFEDQAEQSLPRPCREMNGRPKRTYELTSSIVPRGKALATEAIAECIRSGGVWEAESNIDLLDLVSTPAAADWDASVTVKRINF